MTSDQFIWFAWSLAFLIPWALLYWRAPVYRKRMLWASALTAPFGLTEPLFVPEYWTPPSLFDLAARTGFDIESLIFSFGIGGVGVVLYNVLTRRREHPMPHDHRTHRRHRFHRWALASPFLVFVALLPLQWNPIYPAIAAMMAGAVAAVLCRPDLIRATLAGAALFLAYYLVLLTGLELSAPGYIARVWNLPALSGVLLGPFPLEELLFAMGFGAYWSSVYEHVTWAYASPAGAQGQPLPSAP